MYPLRVVLAGCGERARPHVRRELLNRGIDIEAEFPEVRDILRHRDAFRGTPRLFLVHLQAPEHLTDLRRLSGTFIGRPVVALLDDGREPAALIAAMRAGATQVVPLPLDPADFKSALDCIAIQLGRSPAESRIIAVSGCTGGCGGTTLAINLAHEVAHAHDRQVILAEVSLQMGMLVTYLDVRPKYTLADLIAHPASLDVHLVEQALTRVTDRLSLLAGPERPISGGETTHGKVLTILDFLRHLADVVVLDVPCTFEDSYFEVLAAADQVVLVGEQRIPAIRNAQLVLDALGPRGLGQNLGLVINRYDPDLEGFTARDLEGLLGLRHIATLANDPVRVASALNQGMPLRVAQPNSPVLRGIEALARSLLNLDSQAPAGVPGRTIFSRLFHALKLTKEPAR